MLRKSATPQLPQMEVSSTFMNQNHGVSEGPAPVADYDRRTPTRDGLHYAVPVDHEPFAVAIGVSVQLLDVLVECVSVSEHGCNTRGRKECQSCPGQGETHHTRQNNTTSFQPLLSIQCTICHSSLSVTRTAMGNSSSASGVLGLP